ncbi:MAG: thioredoxin family protein [Akkermansia sp.]|nr:thioredoxin family protein [Akkermansia sp.]
MKTNLTKYTMLALCALFGFSLSGISNAQAPSDDKAAAAKAAKAAKVKFKWGKNLKTAKKQAEETGLPIVILFTGTKWCGYCMKLEDQVLKKKEFKKGMDGVAICVKFEYKSSAALGKSKEAKEFGIRGVPSMVIIDAEGNVLGRAGYNAGLTPEGLIETIKNASGKN